MTNPRVFISSDIGGSDKDDDQSLVHALLYADDLRIEGLVSSPAPHGGRAKDIHEVIDAYAKDYANLKSHSSDYPTPDYLRSVTHQGSTSAQPSAGYSNSTAGSRAIVEAAREGSASDPLYILTWGAMTDVAQALHDAPDIVNKIRLLSIGATNTTFDKNARDYIYNNMDKGEAFENLWWVENNSTFRGMYASSSGANDPSIHNGWIDANVKGHGALGEYFARMSVDLYGAGSVDGLKMGDTPSLMYLLDNAQKGDPSDDGWGGSFKRTGHADNYWTDSESGGDRLGSYNGAKTVYEHRNEYLKDFAARLDRAKSSGDNKDESPAPAPSKPAPAPPPEPEASPDMPKPEPEKEPPPPREPEMAVARISVGRTEAEDLDLSESYEVGTDSRASGDIFVELSGNGALSGAFSGPSDRYDVSFGFRNGNSDTVPFTVRLNLDKGDVLNLSATHWRGDFARLDWLDIRKAEGNTPDSDGSAVSDWMQVDSAASFLLTVDEKNAAAWAVANGSHPAEPEEGTDPEEESELPPVTWIGVEATGLPGEDAVITVGGTEAETLDLEEYKVEGRGSASAGSSITVDGSGQASGVFSGPPGRYDLSVGYINEDDGEATWTVLINGEKVDSWIGTGGRNSTEFRKIALDLLPGDRIILAGEADGSEYARFDSVTIDPAWGSAITEGRTEAETLSLGGGYIVETRGDASAGSLIMVDGSGQAAGIFTGASGTHEITVGYLNEDNGTSSFAVLINGVEANAWTGTGGSNKESTRSFTADLKTGDTITLAGTQESQERARFDWLTVDPVGTDVPTPKPVQKPESTPEPVKAEPSGLQNGDFDAFAFVGQSNAAGHFFKRGGDQSGGSLGSDVFEKTLSAKLDGAVKTINAASSGSGSNEKVDGSSYWWNLSQDKPGPALREAVSKIKAGLGGKDLDGFIWAQGEDDARAVKSDWSNLSEVVNDFTTATRKVFGYLQDQFGDDLPIFVQELGAFRQDNAWLDGPVGALDKLREAQSKLISGMDDVYLGAKTAGLAAYDDIHFNNASYGTIAMRLADSVAVELVGFRGVAAVGDA
ncbi:nucleoside hydrolase-like domain-containing protein [Indioceanicola profundi]|uniref:nucleoside hydrolase-like domain-containing protein n=1 Tax=Indioceanicola profundi TaxID=2220096 RepID=UPI000E6AB648|nr:nucleoside hydrolase-like domain-containing protein [Indioceanicola profundi]